MKRAFFIAAIIALAGCSEIARQGPVPSPTPASSPSPTAAQAVPERVETPNFSVTRSASFVATGKRDCYRRFVQYVAREEDTMSYAPRPDGGSNEVTVQGYTSKPYATAAAAVADVFAHEKFK
ncbi:MAG: hypothetical protein IAI48_00565 [Candidatus Eremiobacteraeota bacterium]|nr:hypothetical protein [Candidatus Eremiobacteraeota bacterium]